VRIRGLSGPGAVIDPLLYVAVLFGEGCYSASAWSLHERVRLPSSVATNRAWNPRWVSVSAPCDFPQSAAIKGITNPVAGAADIPASPNAEPENALAKAITCSAKGKMAGVVLGSKCPLIAAPRSDPHQARPVLMAPGVLPGLQVA
jgi:hypothetical protein